MRCAFCDSEHGHWCGVDAGNSVGMAVNMVVGIGMNMIWVYGHADSYDHGGIKHQQLKLQFAFSQGGCAQSGHYDFQKIYVYLTARVHIFRVLCSGIVS